MTAGTDLLHQFVFSRDGLPRAPGAWPVVFAQECGLAAHPSLPVLNVVDADNAPFGFLLGWPITADGDLVHGALVLPKQNMEAELYRLGGRWVFFQLEADRKACYLDSAGTQPTIYCPSLGLVASSTALVPLTGHVGWDVELRQAMRIPDEDHWYPFGVLPRRGCYRLQPNHRLDLDSFTVERHWPTAPLTVNPDTASAVATVAHVIRRQSHAAVRALPTLSSLSAGMETRMMLACVRNIRTQIQFHTRHDFSGGSEQDVTTARYLARRHGVRHTVVERDSVPVPSPAELEAWLDRTGHCVAGNPWKSQHMIGVFKGAGFTLSGVGGEIARAFYWKREDMPDLVLDAETLLRRTRLPQHPQLLEAGQRYLAGLPGRDGLIHLDLFYLENRISSYGACNRYGCISGAVFLAPIIHRESVDAMLRLPPEYKRQSQLHVDVIRAEWPELLDVPFNKPFGWQRWVARARRIQTGLRKRLYRQPKVAQP